ncbi:rab5 gdp/gtp exchange factor [Anaeramoeba ignava]|uniref:Rab5 gdp/gtp exchange factor n=1 Tax=Anaeramoeba ignava TaxID=1746090 RepID=A0A9Q0LCJ3_ANAIG|nr:rab5 gdp/gtp exchange factor [Anaeramoeba ignava]
MQDSLTDKSLSPFLQFIKNESYKELGFLLIYSPTILIPSEYSLKSIKLTIPFIETHIIFVNKQKNEQFVTANGALGIISKKYHKRFFEVLKSPPKIIEKKNYQLIQNRKYREFFEINQAAFKKKPKEIIAKCYYMKKTTFQFNPKLPESTIIFVSQPLVFSKCFWGQVVYENFLTKMYQFHVQYLSQSQKISKKRILSEEEFEKYIENNKTSQISHEILHFIIGFPSKKSTQKTYTSLIEGFLQNFTEKFSSFPFLSSLSTENLPNENISNTETEAPKKSINTEELYHVSKQFIMKRLHEKLFNVNLEENSNLDSRTHLNFSRLQFLSLKNFRVQLEQNEYEKISSAQEKLSEINQKLTPNDKLDCIVETCKNLMKMTDNSFLIQNRRHFSTLLSYVILKTNPEKLYSNIRFIQNFEDPQALEISGKGYFLSLFLQCVTFLEKTAKHFSSHFDLHESNDLRDESTVSEECLHRFTLLSQHLENAKKILLSRNNELINRSIFDIPIILAQRSSLDEITMKEVPLLLKEYQSVVKLLSFLHERLEFQD